MPKLNKKQKKINILITIVTSIFLTAMALGLQFVHISLPACPTHITKSFTLALIPETLGALAFGPFVGIGIIVVKLVLYFLMTNCLKITLIDNLLMDGIMVFTSGLFYYLQKLDFQKRDIHRSNHRKQSQLISSVFGGAIVSAIAIFLIRYYLIYPFMINHLGISAKQILNSYTIIDYNIKKLSDAVILYDTGILSLKNFVFGIISAMIYKYASPLLHRL